MPREVHAQDGHSCPSDGPETPSKQTLLRFKKLLRRCAFWRGLGHECPSYVNRNLAMREKTKRFGLIDLRPDTFCLEKFIRRMDIHVRRMDQKRLRSRLYCGSKSLLHRDAFWRGLGHECPSYINRNLAICVTVSRSAIEQEPGAVDECPGKIFGRLFRRRD